MRVGIIGIQHEANTFNPVPADMEAFIVHQGQAIVEHFTPAHHDVGGFIEGLGKAGIEIVPLYFARAVPSGVVPDETLAEMMHAIDAQLDAAGKLDGLLLAPHGAAVAQSYPDMDGHWLSHIRKLVGPAMPMIATLDPHANLSQRMVDACDAIIAYRSNPHIDMRQRGLEAAALMARTLAGEVKPVLAAAFPPIAIDIERQHTPSEPCRSMYALADDMLTRPGVLANSIVLGFPYADVVEMGSAFMVVTNDDKALAQKLADELAMRLWDHREDFTGKYVSVSQAIDIVRTSPGPACLLDMGDNMGGGGPGDCTTLAKAMRDTDDLKTFVSLVDPASQAIVRKAGVGATVELELAGKTFPEYGRPLTGRFEVISLHEGQFNENQPRHGGRTHFDAGLTAIVRQANLVVQITSKRCQPSSLNLMLSFGLQPTDFDVIIAKGVHAPTAAYAPVCPTIIRVNTPGLTTADMRQFTYHHRRRPLFPLERDMTWQAIPTE